MTFVVSPIPPEWLTSVRRHGVDDSGACYDSFTADEPGEALRCCLREAEAGERLALVAYRPAGATGAYREIGPVFVHADPCEGYREPGHYPASFRPRRQVLRAYDKAGRIADAIMVEGENAEAGIEQLLNRPEIETVHSRNVLYGCYMFAIDRT
ncbi:DUF1203 domain-containing protein [Actinoplanes sp. NPDC026619]|uniref:DUF1203 domain-containing protein n=1 Tax=Actinoplanes sp. NPDC026619 TaxID=3155798 RepID=UPI0033F92B7A